MSQLHLLKLLNYQYFEQYQKTLQLNLEKLVEQIPEKNNETDSFDFYLGMASTFSSNIEGNTLDFDSYAKNKTFGLTIKKREMDEIDDLVEAYRFAQTNPLNSANLLHTHAIFSKQILQNKNEIGHFRTVKVGVGSGGKMIYLAIEPELLQEEMKNLFSEVEVLLNEKLSIEQTFYFAALLHLVFVMIHPFVDGNGRATRLIEKWFLASKLGMKAWNISSEKNYYLNRSGYYQNLRIGGNYQPNGLR